METSFEKQLKSLKDKLIDDDYANALYASLCNVRWVHQKTKEEFRCSWRYAGELIAKLRDKGECYLDFYCSGSEGKVREDIRRDFLEFGWTPKPWIGDAKVEIIPWRTQD